MALETGTFISDLIVTNPTGADAKSTADDHLRLIKSTVKATFPNITGIVSMTQAQLNSIPNLLVSPALTGTPTTPTATASNATTQIASTAFVQALVAASLTGAVAYSSVGSFAVGAQAYSLVNFATYRSKTGVNAGTDPSLDLANWAVIVPASSSDAIFLHQNFGGF